LVTVGEEVGTEVNRSRFPILRLDSGINGLSSCVDGSKDTGCDGEKGASGLPESREMGGEDGLSFVS